MVYDIVLPILCGFGINESKFRRSKENCGKKWKNGGPWGENILQFNLAGACVPSSAINSNQNWPWQLNPSPEGSSVKKRWSCDILCLGLWWPSKWTPIKEGMRFGSTTYFDEAWGFWIWQLPFFNWLLAAWNLRSFLEAWCCGEHTPMYSPGCIKWMLPMVGNSTKIWPPFA